MSIPAEDILFEDPDDASVSLSMPEEEETKLPLGFKWVIASHPPVSVDSAVEEEEKKVKEDKMGKEKKVEEDKKEKKEDEDKKKEMIAEEEKEHKMVEKKDDKKKKEDNKEQFAPAAVEAPKKWSGKSRKLKRGLY